MAAEDADIGCSPGRKPWLFIREMVLCNFKSYTGEQRIGPFHKMCLNKVSELIHNSSTHQNLESAGVSVYFEEIIDMGEVEQISLMKPKAQGPHDEGFLEYLEDIIGTKQYVEKIEEAYKQSLFSQCPPSRN